MKLPHFMLRDLFWLVLVVAMGLGWWLDSSPRMRAKLQALAVENDQLQDRMAAIDQVLHKRGWRLQYEGDAVTISHVMDMPDLPHVGREMGPPLGP